MLSCIVVVCSKTKTGLVGVSSLYERNADSLREDQSKARGFAAFTSVFTQQCDTKCPLISDASSGKGNVGQLQGVSKKRYFSELCHISVLEVIFNFFMCVLESEF